MPTAEQLRSRLLKKLSELFQLNQPDLDFGFYRIMHSKSKEVKEFIDKDLLKIIADAFGNADESRKAELQAAYEKAIQTAKDFGAPHPEETEPVKKSKAAIDANKDTASSEADVYDHLYRFFERYYDDGDFISRRYYSRETSGKAAPFAIPYNGEELKLHWANADQYYIKSTEHFANFCFDLQQAKEILAQKGSLFASSKNSGGPLKVNFKVIDASEGEHGNVKASDTSKRFFIIHADNPIELTVSDELTINFQYRADSEKTGQDAAWRDKRNGEAVQLILGQLEVRSQAGNEFDNDYATFLSYLKVAAPTEKDKNRPLLAKYINQYTAKNTMDYFIHKDLGGFLRRELDFYIKNEVMRLDDIEDADIPAVESYLAKIKVIRLISGKLIDFLTQLEDFQKKLWLKKKFVVEANYCITLDRVPTELYSEIIANNQQLEEWIRLFAIDEIKADSTNPEYSNPLTHDFLIANDKLLLDTKFFTEEFKSRLLASIDNIDDQCSGLLIHSENFQALNLLERRYRETSKVVYIDPPYNTNASAIPYKNNYRHSSWGTLMADRISLLQNLMTKDSAIFVSIDKNERLSLEFALTTIFGQENAVEELIWSQNTNDGRSPTYSTNHEYVLVYAKNKHLVEQDTEMFREPKPGYSEVMELISRFDKKYPPLNTVEDALRTLYSEHKQLYKEEIESQDLEWETEKRNDPWKGLYNYKHVEYRDEKGTYIPEEEARKRRVNANLWVYRESDWTIMSSESKQSDTTRNPDDPNYRYYEIIHPITGKPCNPSSRGWKGTKYIDSEHPLRNSLESLMQDYRVAFGPDENKVPQQKRFIHEVETNVCKSVFSDYSDGEKETYAMFGKVGVFLAPKHTNFVSRFIQQGGKQDSTVIDCFGGSGSTGHAVIKLNRLDKGERKYILIEMGLHFDTVLKPRILKAIYSADWQKGKPLTTDSGISHCFKYLRLESYEDALNNLEIDESQMRKKSFIGNPSLKEDYMLRYMLDVETRGSQSLLNIDGFKDPTDYTLHVKKPDSEEYTSQPLDLLETFNYLIGLRVIHIGTSQSFQAAFTRNIDPELPEDQNTKLVVDGKIQQDENGHWWFRKVEGWLPKDRSNPNNGQQEKVLIVWRKLTDDLEKDNLILDEWFNKNRISTRDFEFDTIYVNGSNNLPNLKLDEENWKVRLIEEEFMKRTWDTEGV